MNIEISKAEQFKYDLCMNSLRSEGTEIPGAIADIISPIVNEIKYAINLFQNKNRKATEKIVLSGGSALLPNIQGYLSKILEKKVIIGDPWARLSYPADLKPLLNEIGPRMAVAIGLAMRELE
jgi:Tfp pilus assembly PilM family ATPase